MLKLIAKMLNPRKKEFYGDVTYNRKKINSY